ncbi:hypothetical protein KL919_003598 [Ogataea angusta]|nr:hypothetical protein KL920_004517 [Ogataea angusta]KAG7833530.1 hypothetical protein KL943_003638 [Ogataea angusta]KAG7858340.1 hypothetical protein KL919_003598 [Ogataea angusta]
MIFFGSNEERKSDDVPKLGHDPCRIVLRKLPADMDYDRFVDKIASLKGVKSYYFVQGSVSSDLSESPVHSRAYLQMASAEHSKSAVRQFRNSSQSVDFAFANSDIQKALNESVPAPFIPGHQKSKTKLEDSPLYQSYMKMAAGEITEEEFQRPYLAKPKRKKAPKQARSPSSERRNEATEKINDASKKKKEKKEQKVKKEKEKSTSAQQKSKKGKAKKSKDNPKNGEQSKSSQAEPSAKVQIT